MTERIHAFGPDFWMDCRAMRLSYQMSEHRWAVVWSVDEDYTARSTVLTVDRVEPWVAAAWFAPDRVDGSVEPR